MKFTNGLYAGDVYMHYSDVSSTMVGFDDAYVFADEKEVDEYLKLTGKTEMEVYERSGHRFPITKHLLTYDKKIPVKICLK